VREQLPQAASIQFPASTETIAGSVNRNGPVTSQTGPSWAVVRVAWYDESVRCFSFLGAWGQSVPTDKSSSDLIERWRDGDADAAALLYERYTNQLAQLVRNHLNQKLATRFDPEDVVQSVMRSMFRRTQAGSFEFDEDDDVWKLLVTIALNKVRNKARFNRAAKRDARRETSLNATENSDEWLVPKLGRVPDASTAVEFADLLEQFEPRERDLLRLRLEGYSQDEIAEELGVTDRTIRRLLSRIRERLTEVLQEQADSSDP